MGTFVLPSRFFKKKKKKNEKVGGFLAETPCSMSLI